MKRHNTQPLKEVLQEYIDAMKMRSKLNEVSLIAQWEKLVGRTIAASTKDIYVKDRKLFVKINSSVIRSELMHIREPLTAKLNELSGSSVIDDIVLR